MKPFPYLLPKRGRVIRTNQDDWRTWLEANHSTAKERLLVIYKKHTGKPGLSLEEAVEEALCFG